MVQLNASTLSSVKMARGVAPKTERVIQFGEGGFLRAFCDWMIDMANEKAGMDAGVVIVQPIERGMVSMLNEQDGLYTLILRGQVDGKPSKDERIIQSVKRGLSPYEDFEGYLALAHNPDMRIIISNTTEAGIVYTGKDSFDDKPQASYPGKLTDVVTLNPGDEISKDQKVATLSDDTRMRLKQYYSYAYDGKIRAGQSVEVSIPALMSTLTGTVEKVNRVTRITDQGSQLFEADILVKNPGTLTKDMTASASVTVDGETVYPYESGKLEYYRTGDLKSTVSGTVISSSLVDYLSVQAGQVLVRIDGEDSENEIFDVQQNLEDAQKTLDEAQQNLDNCSAAAPIDGTVMGLAIQAGDDVAANTAVITIADTSTIVIDATVDERHISYVQAGMSVDIDQWGTPFTGIVDSISLNSKAENGVASYPMTISVDNPDGTLMTGSYVNYSLVASQNDNCLILPIQCVKSVQLDDGSSADVVFVQSDSRPDNAIDLSIPVDGVPDKGYWPVPVETGISDDFNVEIKSGVEEGAVVFTAVQTQSSFG